MYTVTEAHYDWIVLKPDRTLLCNCGSVRDADAEADARRIARALNMEAAMWEVREALATGEGSVIGGLFKLLNAYATGDFVNFYGKDADPKDIIMEVYQRLAIDQGDRIQALAALDAAGKDTL